MKKTGYRKTDEKGITVERTRRWK